MSSNWIRPSTRLAIYLRDGLACVYCGATVEDGVMLTLDHLAPRSKGGGNDPCNLVTACKRCNSSRQDRQVAAFIIAVAEYLGKPYEEIAGNIRNCRRRKLPRRQAASIIRRRGSIPRALEEFGVDNGSGTAHTVLVGQG